MRASGFLNITKLIRVSGNLLRGMQVNGVASLELPHSLLTTTVPCAKTIQCLTAPSSVHWLLAVSMPCFLGCQLFHPMSSCCPQVFNLRRGCNQTKGTDSGLESPWLSRSFARSEPEIGESSSHSKWRMINDVQDENAHYFLVTISFRLQVKFSPFSAHTLKSLYVLWDWGSCQLTNYKVITKMISSQNSRGVWLRFPTGAPAVICVCCTYGGNILQWYISLSHFHILWNQADCLSWLL